jgi:hypothetical protein
MNKRLKALEDQLAKLPRVWLLVLAVLVLRNPLMDGSFSLWGWYVKMPLEFALLLLAALAVSAALRVGSSNIDDAEGPPLA